MRSPIPCLFKFNSLIKLAQVQSTRLCLAHRIPADLLDLQNGEFGVTYGDIFNAHMSSTAPRDPPGQKRVQETRMSTTDGAAALADAHTLAGILGILCVPRFQPALSHILLTNARPPGHLCRGLSQADPLHKTIEDGTGTRISMVVATAVDGKVVDTAYAFVVVAKTAGVVWSSARSLVRL